MFLAGPMHRAAQARSLILQIILSLHPLFQPKIRLTIIVETCRTGKEVKQRSGWNRIGFVRAQRREAQMQFRFSDSDLHS
jgi:hypothetical protein